MVRRNRNRNTAAVAKPKIRFTAPTAVIEDVHFTHGNSKVEVEFGIIKIKLARHIGSKYKGAMGSQVMEDMAQPTIIEPVEQIREYRM